MAKSMRSKWKRKCRAVKRVRYGKKELDRLKKTLGISTEQSEDKSAIDISEIANITDANELKTIEFDAGKTIEPEVKDEQEGLDCNMEEDDNPKKFNTKTLRDKNGSYPVWLHPRKITRKTRKEKTKLKKAKTRKVQKNKK